MLSPAKTLVFRKAPATICPCRALLTKTRCGCLLPIMKTIRAFPALRRLALILALAAHLITPVASAAGGFDPASVLCAPSGNVSPEARAAIEEMLRLAGVEEENPPANSSGHCGACVMAGCAMTMQPAASLIANIVSEKPIAWTATIHAVPSVHGPPLGLRAPPAHL